MVKDVLLPLGLSDILERTRFRVWLSVLTSVRSGVLGSRGLGEVGREKWGCLGHDTALTVAVGWGLEVSAETVTKQVTNPREEVHVGRDVTDTTLDSGCHGEEVGGRDDTYSLGRVVGRG